jgi:phenylacetate-CoA ligase
MHGLALIYVLRDLPGIRAFKIVQESLDRTRVLVEPAEDFRAEQLATIEQGLQARLGAGVRVEVELVPQIAPEKSGKFRYVVSHVTV